MRTQRPVTVPIKGTEKNGPLKQDERNCVVYPGEKRLRGGSDCIQILERFGRGALINSSPHVGGD